MTQPTHIADLLPHAGDMVLLDELVSCEGDTLIARATVRPGPYNHADGSLPAWLGLELLAQGVGAWAGWQARQAGLPVKLGFLLGTRRYECRVDTLPANATLIIQIERAMQDAAGIGVFECRLFEGETELANAHLNVYQPADSSLYTHETFSA